MRRVKATFISGAISLRRLGSLRTLRVPYAVVVVFLLLLLWVLYLSLCTKTTTTIIAIRGGIGWTGGWLFHTLPSECPFACCVYAITTSDLLLDPRPTAICALLILFVLALFFFFSYFCCSCLVFVLYAFVGAFVDVLLVFPCPAGYVSPDGKRIVSDN